MDDLQGRVAVVTGAAGGIGLGLAKAFVAAGMRVALADVDANRLERALASLGDADAIAVPTDVTDPGSVDALAAATLDAFGAVHVVCNNAGVSTLGYQWETPLDDWHWLMDVNLFGVVHGIRTFVPILLEQGEGHVVNTASMGGLMTSAGSAAYSASKHAVIGLSKALRAELGIKSPDIGVTVMCPGEVATEMPDRIRTRGTAKDDARLDALRARLAEAMPPIEVGRMIVAAIRERTFWVLPNGPGYLAAVQREMDELFGASG